MLYELITSDEDAFNAFFYGIEGTSYEFVDDQVKALNSDDYGFSACWAARTTGVHQGFLTALRLI